MWIRKIKMKQSNPKIREVTADGSLSETEWHKLMEKYNVKMMNA
ncbi:hypothetical protein [[Eubacterium] cellulosolvens]